MTVAVAATATADEALKRRLFVEKQHRANEDLLIRPAIIIGFVINTLAMVAALTIKVASPWRMAVGHGLLGLFLFAAQIRVKRGQRADTPITITLIGLCILYLINLRAALFNPDPQFIVSAAAGYFAVTLVAIAFCPLKVNVTTILTAGVWIAGTAALIGHPAVIRWSVVYGFGVMTILVYVKLKRDQSFEYANLQFDALSYEQGQTARYASEAELHRKDLELAGAAQSLLLPTSTDVTSGRYHMLGSHRSASQVSGDFWWYAAGNNVLEAIIGDVAGHGAGPAMIGASIVGSLRALLAANSTLDANRLPTTIKALNDILCESHSSRMKTVLSAFRFANGQCTWWAAGAPPVFVARPGAPVETVTSISTPVGYDEYDVAKREFAFTKGDRLIAFSDGLVELENDNGEEIGYGAIRRLMGKDVKDLKEVDDALSALIAKYRGERALDDDITYVVVEHL